MKYLKATRDRLVEIVIAMMGVYLVTAGLDYRQEKIADALPPEAWFEVHELYIPDHDVGANPAVFYDRSIRDSFVGVWVVEVQHREKDGGFSLACSGSGSNDYTPGDQLPPSEDLDWEWFIGRPCVVPPGTYRVTVVFDMRKPGFPMKRQRAISNPFAVFPKS